MDPTYRCATPSGVSRSAPAVAAGPQGVPEEVRSVGIRAAVRQEPGARSAADVRGGAGVAGFAARLRRGLRALDARYPGWSQRVGGRLDIEVPALLVSAAAHALFLLVLATAGYAVHTE